MNALHKSPFVSRLSLHELGWSQALVACQIQMKSDSFDSDEDADDPS